MSSDRRPDRPDDPADADRDGAADGDGDGRPDEEGNGEDDRPSNPALDIIDYPLFTPEGGVDRDTFGVFWGTVLLANAAVLALALGPMLIFFRGQWELGGSLSAVGAALLGWVYYRVRTYESRTDAAESGDASDGGGGGGEDRHAGRDRANDGDGTETADGDASADDPRND